MKFLIAATLICFSAGAICETLAPDAVVCESPEPLALLSEDNLKDQPGNVVLKRVDSMIQFYALDAKRHQIYADLANREETIRRDHPGLRQGSTSASASTSLAAKSESNAQGKVYQDFATQCASSGSSPLTVEVLEKKAISGSARVRMPFRGAQAELWTKLSSIK